ncbi:hypothetical protein DTO013E5_3908 [Penicillium roqueforti]|uniref:Genomic scaffold, ProqFM164S01 n=1 Tax=Penicillium roqueforti (strain FM164) TaxID=1365484 RepID=W6PW82_PENRF|nr:uncharacterized protein LCP9604111_1661 [Penicillium roqueforti]CDM28180.1 unnamed protein product [Penicillium roqueforti FM164]KAF9251665.1 hypothetical protein LCP9604111_1661 [Penicillium roqueforti]KAI1836522.1 hypothetical protein CBS147337_2749 [Penicillium roqueforti]KAI2685340.1 hypothetical protein LCP963914a_4667 [Penicillium roqueforti]KAI2690305.1 hypothetical protein CBS147355_756 [Penicillium roqueforti]
MPDQTHPETKQTPTETKKKQAESLAGLPPNTLHIILYIRSDPPLPNDFHWAFYLHKGTATTPGGTKYHARGIGAGWIPGHEATASIFAENFLCVVIQIARIPPETHARVDEIMRSYDGCLNAIPGITCRVWILTVLRVLVDEGFVRCDIGELERECFGFGNENSLTASANLQPRPVFKSRVSS